MGYSAYMGETIKFALGDKVEWAIPGMDVDQCKTGSPYLRRYYHSGVVTKVIAAGESYTNDSYGARSRNHESYEVSERIGKRKPKLFWPLVSKLRKVE